MLMLIGFHSPGRGAGACSLATDQVERLRDQVARRTQLRSCGALPICTCFALPICARLRLPSLPMRHMCRKEGIDDAPRAIALSGRD